MALGEELCSAIDWIGATGKAIKHESELVLSKTYLRMSCGCTMIHDSQHRCQYVPRLSPEIPDGGINATETEAIIFLPAIIM